MGKRLKLLSFTEFNQLTVSPEGNFQFRHYPVREKVGNDLKDDESDDAPGFGCPADVLALVTVETGFGQDRERLVQVLVL